MNNHSKNENGQIIVLMALAFVALLGFVALAVDGGMVFSDRRFDQNTADASAMAGAGYIGQYFQANNIYYETFTCGTGFPGSVKINAENKAVAVAASNNFAITQATSASVPGVFIACDSTNKYVDVQVIIEHAVDTSFAQLIFGGQLKNTVLSKVRVIPGSTMAHGAAIASLSPNCDKPGGTNYNSSDGGIIFDGNNSTTVYNGGIYSASCLYPNGQPSVQLVPNTNKIEYRTTIEGSTKGTTNFDPTPTHGPAWDLYKAPEPDCSVYTNTTYNYQSNNDSTISPGKYSHNGNKPAIEAKKGVLYLEPGLYCVDGDVVISAQAEIKSKDYTSPVPTSHDGVTFYMRTGNFNMGGGGKVSIWAKEGKTYSSNAIEGLLIYMPPNPDNDYNNPSFDYMVNLAGNTGSVFEGTIYAPYSYINFGGNPDASSEVKTELIGYVIRLDGSATIGIHWDGAKFFHSPARISQLK